NVKKVDQARDNPDQAGNQAIKGIKRMRRRDFIKSAALASAGGVVGVGIFSQLSRRAVAAGSNRLGAWSSGFGQSMAEWPLIPIHAALLGDGRLLAYGTHSSGQQRGFFIYDVWDPQAGLGQNAHLTLPNSTQTDIFCSAQIVLPQSGNVLVAGGDNWTGTATTNTGNNNSNIFSPGRQQPDPERGHESPALVRLADHAAGRANLHPGRQWRARPPGDSRPERQLRLADRRRHVRAV